MANRWGKIGNSDILFSWVPKLLWTIAAAMKLKDVCSLEGKLTAYSKAEISLCPQVQNVKAMVCELDRKES